MIRDDDDDEWPVLEMRQLLKEECDELMRMQINEMTER